MKTFFNRPVRILLGTNSLLLLAAAMLAPIYAIFVEQVGGDLLDASIAGGVFALAAGITCLISGRFSDEVRRKDNVMIVGSLIMSIGFLLMTQVESVIHLLLVQSVIGLGEAIYYPPYDALYSHHLDGEYAARAWGAWESMDYFTTAVGAIVGGFIVNTWGFNILFIFMSAFCLLSTLYLYFLPRKILKET